MTVKGENGMIDLATWSDGEFSYSVYSESGMTSEAVTAIAESVK